MNLPSELERARMEHNQAKRRLRSLTQERACRYSGYRENDYHSARRLVESTLQRLTALEQQQRGLAGAETRPNDETETVST